MKIGTALPVLLCLALTSRVASPDDPKDAGAPAESMPLLGPLPEEKSKVPSLAEWNIQTDLAQLAPYAFACRAQGDHDVLQSDLQTTHDFFVARRH